MIRWGHFTLWTHGFSEEFCHSGHMLCFIADSCFVQVQMTTTCDVLRL